MPRQVRLVQDNQAVDSGHGGIDRTHRPSGAVAAKQQPGSVHGEGRQHDCGAGGIGRTASRDSPAKPDHLQRVSGRIGRQRAQSISDGCYDLSSPAGDSLRQGIAERSAERFGMFAGRIDQQPPVDNPPDARRRRATCGCAVCLGSKPPDGDVETRRLPQARRYADLGGPHLVSCDLVCQTNLPGERTAPIDRSIERSEVRSGARNWAVWGLCLSHYRVKLPLNRRPARRARTRAAGRRRSPPGPEPARRTGARRGSRGGPPCPDG